MEKIDWKLLKEIAELEKVPQGAYNFRVNGQMDDRKVTANIDITSKTDKPGIDITIKPGTKGESVHIPVVLTQAGLTDLVYNDFYVGEGADVDIVAGCTSSTSAKPPRSAPWSGTTAKAPAPVPAS